MSVPSRLQGPQDFGPANFTNQYSIVDNFNSAYWEGIGLRVYIGKQFIKEAVQFNYQILEQIRPYYGYASHVAKRIHHGTRVIVGEFTLNFTTESYFYSLLDKLRKSPEAGALVPREVGPEQTRETLPPIDFLKLGVESGTDLTNLPLDQLAKLAENYRKGFRSDPNRPLIEEGTYNPVVRNDRGLFQIFDYQTGLSREMDITLIYGADLKDGLVLNMLNNADAYYADNSLTFNDNDLNQRRPVTGIRFIGASVNAQAKSIDDSGRPIMETYAFQARNVQIITNRTILGNVKPIVQSGRPQTSLGNGLP